MAARTEAEGGRAKVGDVDGEAEEHYPYAFLIRFD
jgi:uncharacterized protein Veg